MKVSELAIEELKYLIYEAVETKLGRENLDLLRESWEGYFED